MEKKEDTQMKLCEKHQLQLTLYCDSEGCKRMLCKKCLLEEDHDFHKLYGLGALKESAISATISQKLRILTALDEQLREALKELAANKHQCETYQDEIRKIGATEIGKAMLEQVGKNDSFLLEKCKTLLESMEENENKANTLLFQLDEISTKLDLNELIEQHRTLQQDILETEIEKLTDPLLMEGKEVLKCIERDQFGEQLDVFKTKLSKSVDKEKPEAVLPPKSLSQPVQDSVPKVIEEKSQEELPERKKSIMDDVLNPLPAQENPIEKKSHKREKPETEKKHKSGKKKKPESEDKKVDTPSKSTIKKKLKLTEEKSASKTTKVPLESSAKKEKAVEKSGKKSNRKDTEPIHSKSGKKNSQKKVSPEFSLLLNPIHCLERFFSIEFIIFK